MYYYIFDPPQGAKEYERVAQVKELLSSLGIAGEMVSPSPGKSISQLVDLAITKRYSTVIAVGSMALINQVARAIHGQPVVLGIIPLFEHPDLVQLIGVTTWQAAAEQLKRRRWQPIHVGVLNSSVSFLTSATIEIPSECGYWLHSENFSLQSQGGSITITPTQEVGNGLLVQLSQPQAKPGLFSFRKPDPLLAIPSRFQLNALEIKSSQALSVTVAGSVVATTPLHATTHSEPIRLIVGRRDETLDDKD